MNDLDARAERIERVLTNQSLLEMAQRIDALQAELRTMRGEVELLQNESAGGKQQTRSLYGDLDKRSPALETLGGGGAGSGRRRRAARSVRRRRAARPVTGGEQASLRRGLQRAEGRRLSDAPSRASATFHHLSRQPARRAMRSTGSARRTT